MGNKKTVATKESKGRKNLQSKTNKPAAKKVKGKPAAKKAVKKVPVGYSLLKREEAALVKSYAALEKTFNTFADKLNVFCYEDGDKMKASVECNKSIMAFNKQTGIFRKALMKSKEGLKPIYKVVEK